MTDDLKIQEGGGVSIITYEFNFLGSDRLPYDPTVDGETARTYFVNEKLKFRLGLPVENVVGENLSLIVQIGGVSKSIPYSKSSSTGEYVEFHYVVSGSDAGRMVLQTTGGVGVGYGLDFSGSDVVYRTSGSGSYSRGPFDNVSFEGYWPAQDGVIGQGPQVTINGADSSGSVRASTLLLKRSSEPGKAPSASDLLSGELAINTNDGKLYAKIAEGSIKHLNSIEPQIFSVNSIAMSTTQNNLNLSGGAVARVVASAEDLEITGIVAGSNGQILMMYNAGSNAVSILNRSESSDLGNRIIVFSGSDYVLQPDSGITLLYDSTSAAWRLF